MSHIRMAKVLSRSIATLSLLVLFAVLKPPLGQSFIEGDATSYSLTLSSSNGPVIDDEGFGSSTNQIGHVAMSYTQADDDVISAHVKLASSGGKISNLDIITDVSSFKAVFSGGSLYLGGANHYGEIENITQLYSNTINYYLPEYPYYVIYAGGTGDVTITSVVINYSCQNPTLPPGITLTEYENYYEVSAYTGTLRGVNLPAYYRGKLITKIGPDVFKNNTSLELVALPNTIIEIGASAFEGCTNLESISGSDRLQSIGAYAFHDCQSLISFDFPSTLTHIGAYAFAYCIDLLSVNLRPGLTAIYEGTFSYCLSATSFNIPSTITLIESYAFAVNTQVEEISVPGTITTIEADAFRKLINCTLRVSAPSRPSGWSYNWATEYYAIIWNS